MKNIVYITTNKINGKQYVGSHKISNPKRDYYLGSGVLISNAIKKYGRKNFEREILKECKTIREARLLESEYIKTNNTLIPEGYNISPDGGAIFWEEHTKESRIKISEALKGKTYEDIYGDKADEIREKRSMERKGKKFNKEWRKNISISHKGYKLSEDHKQKIGDFNRNKIVSKSVRKKIR